MALELNEGITLYLARHGETVANVEHRFQGRTDTPLTDRGRAQAKMVASILADRLKGKPTPRFVSSPLPRARTTMGLILQALGLSLVYATDPRLMEINLGAWDGLTDDEARALDPAMWEKRTHDKWNVRVPGGGENYAMVAERLTAWAGELKGDTVAISHGAATRIFRGLASGLDWEQMSALDEPQDCVFVFRDGIMNRLDYEGPPIV
ncbi:MAG TPA: histidine phosphatase family protein [Micropepsaceae bacterium]|nr:histidine phosphatase family protein [Micropepsaceae bacterium]